MVWQGTVNPPTLVTVGSIPTTSTSFGLLVYWLECCPVTAMGRVRFSYRPPERSTWLVDSVTRMMRSGVTPKCGTTLTEVALATR